MLQRSVQVVLAVSPRAGHHWLPPSQPIVFFDRIQCATMGMVLLLSEEDEKYSTNEDEWFDTIGTLAS